MISWYDRNKKKTCEKSWDKIYNQFGFLDRIFLVLTLWTSCIKKYGSGEQNNSRSKMEADFAFKKYGGRKYFFDTLLVTSVIADGARSKFKYTMQSSLWSEERSWIGHTMRRGRQVHNTYGCCYDITFACKQWDLNFLTDQFISAL